MITAPFLVSLLTLALLTTLTNSYFIHNFCENTRYFYRFTKSRDETNLNLMLSSLILKTPKTGFSMATEGEPPNRVYGLALCRGDISNDNCTSCLNTAAPHLLQLCPYPKGGMVWYSHYAVRYSIHNFYSQLPADNDCKGFYGVCTQEGTPDQFHKNLISMLQSISKIAAFNESARMFATGVNAQTYAMVQCTRDLSDQQCFKCLNQFISTNLQICGCFFGRVDIGSQLLQTCGLSGSFVRWSCIVTYSTGKFFNSDPSWVAPPDHYRLIMGRSNFSSSLVIPNPIAQWTRLLGMAFR